MKTLVIEKQAVKQNIAVLKQCAGSALIYGVLVGDAYGTGLVDMARLLRDEGISRFAVSEAREAEALRKAGFVDEEILMLRSTVDREELEHLIDLNIICTIGSTDSGMVLNSLAEGRSTVVEAHIQVDTGLGFGGFLTEEPDKVLAVYRNLPNVAISGIYTQIHSQRTDDKTAAAQLDGFQALLEAIRTAGFETGIVHAAGSFALLHYDFARLDAVRPGSALLGRCRRIKGDGLQRAGYGEAGLEDVRWLPKGHTVGSQVPVTLRRPTRVAVLPVGYLNGFGIVRTRDWGPIAALRRWWKARKTTVRVGTQKVRVLGRIGALETLLDVTNLNCASGDLAYFDMDPMYAK
ncbi:MAG: alanine racemase, partial [Pseudoflavonifractor sp.]